MNTGKNEVLTSAEKLEFAKFEALDTPKNLESGDQLSKDFEFHCGYKKSQTCKAIEGVWAQDHSNNFGIIEGTQLQLNFDEENN